VVWPVLALDLELRSEAVAERPAITSLHHLLSFEREMSCNCEAHVEEMRKFMFVVVFYYYSRSLVNPYNWTSIEDNPGFSLNIG
jgi:hypothetical protein